MVRNRMRIRTWIGMISFLAAWFVASWDPFPANAARLVSVPEQVSVAVRGSTVFLSFFIPGHPAGSLLDLSVDHARVLERSAIGGKVLTLCIDGMPPGKHLLGYELSGPDQVVRTDERFIAIDVPEVRDSPDCPPVR